MGTILSTINPQWRTKLSKKISETANNLEKIIFTEAARDRISQWESKLSFYVYACSVGFLFDDRINQQVRKIWAICQLSGSLITMSCCTLYVSDLNSAGDLRVITIASLPIIMPCIQITYLSIGYYYRKNLLQFVEFFLADNERLSLKESNETTTELNCKFMDVKKLIITAMAMNLNGFLISIVLLDMESIMPAGSFTKRCYIFKYFPMWYPFDGESVCIQNIIRILQTIITLPAVSIFACNVSFILMIVAKLYNKFLILNEKMESISVRAFEQLQKMDKVEDEALAVGKAKFLWMRALLKNKRAEVMDTFYSDFVQCINRYQRLRREAHNAKLFVESNISVYYSVTMLVICLTGFIFSLYVMKDDTFSIGALGWCGNLGICLSIWYVSCIFGNIFKEMNENITERVYNSPWYYLNLARCKTVLIFLTCAQIPLELKVLKVISLATDDVPQYANSVYSHIQIMVGLFRKKYHSK